MLKDKTRQKSVPMSFCPQIRHGLPWELVEPVSNRVFQAQSSSELNIVFVVIDFRPGIYRQSQTMSRMTSRRPAVSMTLKTCQHYSRDRRTNSQLPHQISRRHSHKAVVTSLLICVLVHELPVLHPRRPRLGSPCYKGFSPLQASRETKARLLQVSMR